MAIKKTERTVIILISIALVLLVINIISTLGLYGKLGEITGKAVKEENVVVDPEEDTPPARVTGDLTDDDPAKGDKNAPVTIVEFSDYQCPFCQRFVQQTLPLINERYVKTGKVRLVFRDYPLPFHQYAQKAAEASECADEQGKFWEMHDKLFSTSELGIDTLKNFAKEIGLDTTKFNSCLDSGKYASEVQKDMTDGSKYGVRGTPAFLINGVLVSGAQPFQNFQTVIEQELNK
jgi:protein-disulfide isomerase